MNRQRVLATRPAAVNYEKLWAEARAAWANAIDISDVDGSQLGFDFDGAAPTTAQVQALVNAHNPGGSPPPLPDPQIAQDKTQVATFMSNPSGTATAAQRDDTIKAIVRYLRRSWNDA